MRRVGLRWFKSNFGEIVCEGCGYRTPGYETWDGAWAAAHRMAHEFGKPAYVVRVKADLVGAAWNATMDRPHCEFESCCGTGMFYEVTPAGTWRHRSDWGREMMFRDVSGQAVKS